MRLRRLPFCEEVEKFLEQQKLCSSSSRTRDAQMRSCSRSKRACPGKTALAAALQRAADFLGVHRQGCACRSERRRASSSSIQSRCRMTFLPKPKVRPRRCQRTRSGSRGVLRGRVVHALARSAARLDHCRCYRGTSWGIDIEPQNMVKLSGIGCSSKPRHISSPAATASFRARRMPSIAMGANSAQPRPHLYRCPV